MKKIYLTILLLVLLNNAFAQSWAWAQTGTGGSGSCKSVCTDQLGNVYIAGNYDDTHITFGTETLNYAGQTDAYLVKYNSAGAVVWAKNIGGTCGDYATAVCTDVNGNIYVTGYFCSASLTVGSVILPGYNGSFNIFFAKYDTDGNVIWAKTSTGPIGCDNQSNSIAVDANGNCFIAGSFTNSTLTFGAYVLTNGAGTGAIKNLFVAKFDGDGNVLWAKSAGGADNAVAYAVCTDAAGNAFITGAFRNPTISFDAFTLTNSGNYDSYLVKYSPAGAVLWAKKSVGSNVDMSKAVSADPSGNVYITGYFAGATISFDGTILTHSDPPQAAFRENMFLVKYDATGNVTWAKNAGGTGGSSGNFGYSVSAYNNGVYVTGKIGSSSLPLGAYTLTPTVAAYDPMFIANYNAQGNVVYATYLEGGGSVGNAVYTDNAGNAYIGSNFNYSVSPFSIGGNTFTSTGIENIFVAKLSAAFVLPVTLTDFITRVTSNRKIQLRWNTAAEVNITDYTVQRSVSGNNNFVAIANVKARAGSTSNTYFFTDNEVLPGVLYYYRLAINENGMAKKYSDIIKQAITSDALNDISIINPTRDIINLKFTNLHETLHVTVINNAGQVVLQKAISPANATSTVLLDIRKLAAGSYWVKISTEANTVVKKLVKL